jgi:hypothetical protein
MTNTLESAIAYARRGWHVVPLHNIRDGRCSCASAGQCSDKPGKHPRTPHGYHDATDDEAQIHAWWSHWPDANIGIAIAPSGLVVLDVDVGEGKRGRESLATLDGELVETLTARTGSGGLHAIYSRPDGVEPFRKIGTDKTDHPGLDILADGYIVAAPSNHISGGSYSWIVDAPVASCPLALTAKAKKPAPAVAQDLSPRGPATPEILRAAAARLERHGPAIRGQGGNAHTRSAWGLLVHDYALSESEAFPLLLVWNLTCVPPWEPAELRRGPARSGQTFSGPYGAARDIVDGAGAIDDVLAELEGVENDLDPFALDDLGEPLSPWEEALAKARAEIIAALGIAEASSKAPEPLFESAITLLGKTFPRTPWLVRGLVVEGGVIILGGAPKTGKSWLLTELAIAVCSGTPALGKYATGEKRTAAYFYAEDIAQSVQSHIAALCHGRGDPVDVLRGLHVQPRGRFLDVTRDDECALIVASCRQIGKVDLLCLEPLRDLHSGVENDSDAMAPVMKRLRVIGEIVARGQGSPCTVAVAHHAKKTTDTPVARAGEGLRGSGAIFGSADAVIELMNPGGNGEDEITAHVKVTLRGARAAAPFDLALKIDDGPDGTAVRATYEVLTPQAAQAKATLEGADRDALIIAAVRNSTDQCLSKNALCDLVSGGKQKRILVIDDLIRRGLLVPTDRHPIHGAPLGKPRYRLGEPENAEPEDSPE